MRLIAIVDCMHHVITVLQGIAPDSLCKHYTPLKQPHDTGHFSFEKYSHTNDKIIQNKSNAIMPHGSI